ncbi:NAD(P)H-dependent glycerol-3-phosphate dehydrogenase [Roseomonas sp. BN140053]|uniref:NAD(P)H-dependent glycerol-3-phosphate dehydrogenase n=1 Tax=Roseomonas sp. BN140053 TaxID=3391898 RepID=UPI0039E95304
MSDAPLAVIGAGAWGTALAIQAARSGPVALWARDPARAAAMRGAGENPRLPGAALSGLRITADAAEALAGAALCVLAVPVQHLRATLAALSPALPPAVMVAKGVEAGRLALPLEIVADCHPGLAAAVLSGPNFAHEVAAGLPAAATLASDDPALCDLAAARLSTPGFRLYGSADPLGVQLCGAAKNVVAIAAGAAIGAGLGENARAALVARALAEIARLVVASGGRAETASGLSGLGDLLLTCTGSSSRNFALGHALGRGVPAAEALAGSSGVVEGAATAPALLARAESRGVEMPVCAAVVAVLDGRLSVRSAVERLMERPRRGE